MARPKKIPEPEAQFIVISMLFDDTGNPHANIVSLQSGGGATIKLTVPQNQVPLLTKLFELGMNKTMKVIFDIDGTFELDKALLQKAKFIESINLNPDDIRKTFTEISTEDITDFSDNQIRALKLLTSIEEDEQFSDEAICKFLNIELKELKGWKHEVKFRKIRNDIIKYNVLNSEGDLYKSIVRGAKQSAGSNDRKLLAKALGIIDDRPVSQVDLTVFTKDMQETQAILTNRDRILFPKEKKDD
jgi:hypothetical protein